MLTNAFYFTLYRPYILGSRDAVNNYTSRRARIAERTPQYMLDHGMTIVLNKALKDEIVKYAQNVSCSVTGLKYAVRSLINDIENFSINTMEFGFEAATQAVEERLTFLSDTYNENTTFMRQQQHSPQLRTFSYEIGDNVYHNQYRLEKLGFSFSEEGVHFDPVAYRILGREELQSAFNDNIQVFISLYQSTDDILAAPLSDHMHFRSFSYHYNYKLGRMVEDGFGIIQSGMLLDLVF